MEVSEHGGTPSIAALEVQPTLPRKRDYTSRLFKGLSMHTRNDLNLHPFLVSIGVRKLEGPSPNSFSGQRTTRSKLRNKNRLPRGDQRYILINLLDLHQF